MKKLVDIAIELGAGVVGVVAWLGPVGLGVVEEELDAVLVAGVGQFLADVATKGRAHDVVVGHRRVEHAEALMVLGREHEVLGAGRLDHATHWSASNLTGLNVLYRLLYRSLSIPLVTVPSLEWWGRRPLRAQLTAPVTWHDGSQCMKTPKRSSCHCSIIAGSACKVGTRAGSR